MIPILLFFSIIAIDQTIIYNECKSNSFDFDIPYQVNCELEVDNEHPLFEDCIEQNFEGTITMFHNCEDYRSLK